MHGLFIRITSKHFSIATDNEDYQRLPYKNCFHEKKTNLYNCKHTRMTIKTKSPLS